MPVIEFKDVIKSFSGRTVLQRISFSIEEGQIAFVLGTSGTGKSVLLKNLVGLMAPDSGEIWIQGQETSRFTEDQYLKIRQNCGMVFQQPALFDSLTVFENVAFGLRRLRQMTEEQIRETVLRSLNLVQLTAVEEKFPFEISYGMQKRVSLARTVALEPRILLFDEPTTGLDPITTTAVNELIKKLSHQLKTTSIVVSHDMQCALSIADLIIVLDKGQVVEMGSVQAIKASKQELVREFLREVVN